MTSEACYPMPGVAKAPFCFAFLVCIEHSLLGFSSRSDAHVVLVPLVSWLPHHNDHRTQDFVETTCLLALQGSSGRWPKSENWQPTPLPCWLRTAASTAGCPQALPGSPGVCITPRTVGSPHHCHCWRRTCCLDHWLPAGSTRVS